MTNGQTRPGDHRVAHSHESVQSLRARLPGLSMQWVQCVQNCIGYVPYAIRSNGIMYLLYMAWDSTYGPICHKTKTTCAVSPFFLPPAGRPAIKRSALPQDQEETTLPSCPTSAAPRLPPPIPMETKPYFLWRDTNASSAAAASDPDLAAVFASSGAPVTALLASAAGDAAAVSSELAAGAGAGASAAVARPRLRRSSSGSGKQPQQQGGGAGRKPPQRGLGVAELERLRCGGDPLRDLSAVVVDAAGAQGHPLLHYHPHHHHLQMPPSALEAGGGARYCSQLLAPAPPAPPAGPVCFVHPPAAAGCQRAPLVAPEQQYFRDRWGRIGGFTPAVNGSGGGAEHQPQLLLPAPEHPSSQNTIWRPAVPSSSSCLQTGHRCDFCCRVSCKLF